MRPALRGAAAAALVLLALVAGALPAAADPRIGLSGDGATWVETLESPVLPAGMVWVPGDTATGTFWVRNQSGEAVTGWVDVLVDGGGELAAALSTATSVDGGAVAEGTRSEQVALAPGQVVQVSTRVTFPAAVTDPATMLSAGHVSWRVTFVGLGEPTAEPTPGPTTAPTVPPAADGGSAARPLPTTGLEPGPALLAAAAALAVGVAVRRVATARGTGVRRG